METAKVDIRKLQMLNDRIAQTIDALNQVRMSVHGVAQSAPQPFTQNAWSPYPSPYGFSHSPQPQATYGQPGFAPPPYGQQPYGQPSFAPFAPPGFAQAYAPSPFGNGIGHTSGAPIEALLGAGIDPTVTQRMAQTFPFVQWGYSPYGSPLF